MWLFIDSFLTAKNSAKQKYTLSQWITLQDIDKHNSKQIYRPSVQVKNKSNKKTVEQKKPQVNNALLEDCKAAMKSLGVDKKQQTYLINTLLKENESIKTVQDFLKKAFV